MLGPRLGRVAAARVRRRLLRRVRKHRVPRERAPRELLSGLGRSDSKKRVARAGWLDAITREIHENLEIVLDQISTGQQRPSMPLIRPEADPQQASQELADSIWDLLPGKKEVFEKVFGDEDYTEEEKKPAAAKKRAPARAAAGGGLMMLLPLLLFALK